jgi:hypothetical protein
VIGPTKSAGYAGLSKLAMLRLVSFSSTSLMLSAAHAGGADADEHLNEFGSGNRVEWHFGFASDCARKQSFSDAGGPNQQDPGGARAPNRP